MTATDQLLREIAARLARLEQAVIPANAPDLLTVDQVASIKGVSAETVRRWARDGKLKCVAGERPYRFKREDV